MISDWRRRGPEPNTAQVRLEKGEKVDFRIDYFQKKGNDLFKGDFTRHDNQRVVYRGEARYSAVNVTTRCITHYNGVMKVKMTLKPGAERNELRRLWLDIPVRGEQAPLFHSVMTGNIRENPAGRVPAGTGRVWDSRERQRCHSCECNSDAGYAAGTA